MKTLFFLFAIIALLSGVLLKVIVASHNISVSATKREAVVESNRNNVTVNKENNKKVIVSIFSAVWGIASLISFAGLFLKGCRRNATYLIVLIINLILIMMPIR